MRHDQALEQRIARQAIRAVQTGAGHFADRVKTGQRRGPVHVGLDAAALIMRGRDHRDRLFRHVDPETQAGFVNVRETLPQELGRLVRDIEKDALRARALDLRVDRAGHDVPRRERTLRVISLHEILAAAVAQNSALARAPPRKSRNDFAFG